MKRSAEKLRFTVQTLLEPKIRAQLLTSLKLNILPLTGFIPVNSPVVKMNDKNGKKALRVTYMRELLSLVPCVGNKPQWSTWMGVKYLGLQSFAVNTNRT
jgi:MarR-like DNA-binding transcriptional regulator SgrR of sgrS sRNA